MTLPSRIAAPVESTLEIKRSVFVAHVAPVESVEDAEAVIARIRKERWDARHHCTAMVIGAYADRQRSSDDGEPAGTAGVPMLEVLRHRGVTDVVAVVSRWFGGILLGAGGLVRAYGSSVTAALDAAAPVRRAVRAHVIVDAAHADAGRILALLHHWANSHDAVVDSPAYDVTARLGAWIAPEDVPALDAEIAAATGGAVVPRIVQTAGTTRHTHTVPFSAHSITAPSSYAPVKVPQPACAPDSSPPAVTKTASTASRTRHRVTAGVSRGATRRVP